MENAGTVIASPYYSFSYNNQVPLSVFELGSISHVIVDHSPLELREIKLLIKFSC